MKTILFLTTALALAGTARAEGKPLGELNDMTKSLAAKVKLETGELEVAEVVAVRDSLRIPSPQALAYAAALEKGIADKKLPVDRASKALIELALDLAAFGGPEAETYKDLFGQALNVIDQVRPGAKPRPELAKQLDEVGQWADATVTQLSPKLSAPLAARARVRLAMERGHWAEARDLAKLQVKGPGKTDPVWQGYLGAALLLDGKDKEAAPHVTAALAAGGEAERLVRTARVRRTRNLALETAGRALKTVGIPVIGAASGGKGTGIPEACRRLFAKDGLPASAPAAAVSDATVACATVLWDSPAREWLPRAAELAPAGAPGASIRAAAQLMHLMPEGGGKRGDDATRKQALDKYLAEIKTVSVDEPGQRRILDLLGWLGAAENPMSWQPRSETEHKLVSEVPTCDAEGFPLRAVAARPDRAKLAELVELTVRKCADAPGGAAVTRAALELGLQLAHEDPSPIKADLEPQVLKFARPREGDAEALAVHADAVALKALSSGAPRIALEAALSRYEQAIARWSPASGGALRQRIESNAAFLSLLIGRTIGDALPEARAKFYLRGAGHLRTALALGETPAITAVRALYDVDTATGTTVTTLDLPRLPPGRARNRAACMMAAQASARGDAVITKKLLELAGQKPAGEEHKLDVPEMLVETNASLSVLLDQQKLRPFVDLRTALWLAPRCDPSQVKVPEAKAAAAAPSKK